MKVSWLGKVGHGHGSQGAHSRLPPRATPQSDRRDQKEVAADAAAGRDARGQHARVYDGLVIQHVVELAPGRVELVLSGRGPAIVLSSLCRLTSTYCKPLVYPRLGSDRMPVRAR